MKVTDLSKAWQEGQEIPERSREYRLRMPLEDAARLSALAALHPNKTEGEILNDIANAAIEDLAEVKRLKSVGTGDGQGGEQH